MWFSGSGEQLCPPGAAWNIGHSPDGHTSANLCCSDAARCFCARILLSILFLSHVNYSATFRSTVLQMHTLLWRSWSLHQYSTAIASSTLTKHAQIATNILPHTASLRKEYFYRLSLISLFSAAGLTMTIISFKDGKLIMHIRRIPEGGIIWVTDDPRYLYWPSSGYTKRSGRTHDESVDLVLDSTA